MWRSNVLLFLHTDIRLYSSHGAAVTCATTAVLAVLVVALSGCVSETHIKAATAAVTGCPPTLVHIKDEHVWLSGDRAWTAECAAVRYYCSSKGHWEKGVMTSDHWVTDEEICERLTEVTNVLRC